MTRWYDDDAATTTASPKKEKERKKERKRERMKERERYINIKILNEWKKKKNKFEKTIKIPIQNSK